MLRDILSPIPFVTIPPTSNSSICAQPNKTTGVSQSHLSASQRPSDASAVAQRKMPVLRLVILVEALRSMGRPTNRLFLIGLLVLLGPQFLDSGWADRFCVELAPRPLHAQDQLPVETDGLAEAGDGEGEYQEELLPTHMAPFQFRFPMTVLSTDVSATGALVLASSVFHPPTNV